MNHNSTIKLSVSQFLCLGVISTGLLLSGCQNYTQESADFASSWKSANLQGASDEVAKKASSNADTKDTIIWRLEQGAVLRTAALANLPAPATPSKAPASTMGAADTPEPREQTLLKGSNEAFAAAEAKINRYDEDAKVKMGSEVGAAFTNLATLPYKGKAYDRIMLHTYKAMNYMKLGQMDSARVEFNKALQRQRDAVEENQKRIAEAQKAERDAKSGKMKDEKGKSEQVDVSKSKGDAKTASAFKQIEDDINSQVKGYSNYVNPFSVFIEGLYFTAQAEGSSDMERARKSIERVVSMNPDNPYLRQDLALAQGLATGSKPDGTTYVIFETGTAASLEEWSISIPFFLVTSRVSYSKAAFPKLKYDPNFLSYIDVTANGQSSRSSMVCSMDSVIAQDFKNEWPIILTKTLIATGVKAAMDAAIQNQTKDQGAGYQLAGMLFSAVYNAATSIADTRSWTTLPKQFQYCRVATPADRTLTISAGTLAPQTVKLEPGQVNLVIVKNVAPNLPVYISQIVLK
jgi:hypothetical protein